MKRGIIIGLLLFPLLLYAQEKLTLEQCRKMALEHNHKIKEAKEHVGAATALKKSAKTQFLPGFSANGTYQYLNKRPEYSVHFDEMHIPIIPLNAEGNIDATRLPDYTNNTWASTPLGVIPLDSEGNPFDPRINPEKLMFNEAAMIPEMDTSFAFGSNHNFLGSVTMTQPVYLGGKIRETYNIAKYGENLATEKKNLTESEILFEIDAIYWQVKKLEQKQTLTTEYLSMLDQLVKRLNDLHEEGLITQNEILKAKVKRNEIELKKLKSENGVKLARMALCQKIGQPLMTAIELTDSLGEIRMVITDNSQMEKALANRPEIGMANQAVNIANSGVKIMRSRYLPNVLLTANYFFVNPNVYNNFGNSFGSDLNVGLMVNIPLFHWGDKKHTLNAAKHELNVANLKMEEAKELISLQVQQAIYLHSESVKQVQMANTGLEQASENLKTVQNNFDEGILTLTDLLEAQVMWQKSFSDLIDAKTNHRVQESHLLKVTGELNRVK